MSTYWTQGGNLLIDGDGKLILCDRCPCPGTPVLPACCSSGALPATATATYTIGALAAATLSMTKLGSGYTGEYDCDVGDGHTLVVVQCTIACSSAIWDMSFAVSVYIDGVLDNFVTWLHSYNVGSAYGNFSLVCSPFHLSFTGTNTSGVVGGTNPRTCGGVNYPFALAGGLGLVLDIVTP